VSRRTIFHRAARDDVRGIRRSPYVVYYELHDDDIVILAVWHGRRDPEGWQDR